MITPVSFIIINFVALCAGYAYYQLTHSVELEENPVSDQTPKISHPPAPDGSEVH